MEQRDDDRANAARSPLSRPGFATGPFSAREAADLLGVHERTVRRAIRDGRLVAARPGRAYAVAADALDRYWEARHQQDRLRADAARPMLRLVPRVSAVEIEQPGPPRFGAGSAGSVPQPLTSFVGRTSEVAALARLVTDGARLVTLTGPGGVGKTRLAIAAALALAPEFAGGAVFAPLAAVSDPALVLPAIARALDVRESAGRPLLDTLGAALRGERLLLILDNVEHLLPGAADVARLLAACPLLRIVATSREPLRLGGEQRFATSPLALPRPNEAVAVDAAMEVDAVRLFVERASLAAHGFHLSADNAADVCEICRRLDGLPLAIELAAAWAPVLRPDALLRQLEQRLPLLRGGGEDQPTRLRTMRDAIAWSYALLTPEEARLFRRLAVFVGGFTLDAAAWVTGDGYRVSDEDGQGTAPYARHPSAVTLDFVAALADKSLLQPQSDGPDTRFLMLETVREFASEQLAAGAEAGAVAAAHAAFVADFAEQAEPHLLGPEERRWMARCDAEMGNVRAALAWSLEHDVETALRIVAALWISWSVDHLREGRRWLGAALARPSPVSEAVRGRALTTHAALACLMGDFDASEAEAQAAVALTEAAGDALWEARARWVLASSRFSRGELAQVMPELDRSLALFAGAATSSGRAHAAYAGWTQASSFFMLGDVERGGRAYERALAQARESQSAAISMILLSDYAAWLGAAGEPVRARRLLEEARSLATVDSAFTATSLMVLGLAFAAAMDDAAETAARLVGAIEAMLARKGIAAPAHFQDRLDRAATKARERLGDDAFAGLHRAGSADPETVIAAALEQPLGPADPERKTSRNALTARERQVLGLLVAGRADKEIAAALGISRATASRHVGAIRSKLDAPSRSAAVAHAVRDNLV